MVKLKKRKASISIMVAVFCVAFLAFCAFGIDMAYVTLNRAKLQRSTETAALASIARYKSTKTNESQNLFTLFKSRFNSTENANIVSSQIKEAGGDSYKIKLSTELMSPTYFLRFAGVGGVKIEATSYAQTYQKTINDKQFGDLVELESTMTDKKGPEFQIKTNGYSNGYFVFAGTKNENGKLMWADMGCKAESSAIIKNVQGKNYNLICAADTKFDLSKVCSDGTKINIVKYFKVYGANSGECTSAVDIGNSLIAQILQKIEESKKNDKEWIKSFPQKDAEGNEIPWDKLVMPQIPQYPISIPWLSSLLPAPSTNPYSLIILNNVKLITRENF